jgi:hypothetical protein
MWQEAAMIHQIMKSTSSLQSPASVVGASLMLALAAGGLAGCASASQASATPATQAAAIARIDCGPDSRDDAQVTAILNGSLVEGATPLYSGVENGHSHEHLEGAKIRVRPMKGTSAEWLARALMCHGAEQTLAQAQGRTVASDPFYLPASVPYIHVRSAGDAFEVQVTGATNAEGAEILSRARALAHVSGFAQAPATADHEIATDSLR